MPDLAAAAWPTLAFLAFIIVQRLSELAIARRNTARLLDRGAVEHGADHYPAMVMLHTAWIVALVLLGMDERVQPIWLAVFAVLQVCRLWILLSLGERWTTRIIVLDEPLVTRGPFAFLKHPNYALVCAEIFVAPMVLGLVWVALLFSALNAAMLFVRIRAEDRALSGLREG